MRYAEKKKQKKTKNIETKINNKLNINFLQNSSVSIQHTF